MTDLCVSCNLCCNGSIFARVPIELEEQDHMPKGIDFFSRDGKLRMPLPCPKLGSDGACTCYEVRPAVCRTYNCKLSKRTNAGEIGGEEAEAIISEIKTTQSRARALAAQAMGVAVAELEGQRFGAVFRKLKTAQKDDPSKVQLSTDS